MTKSTIDKSQRENPEFDKSSPPIKREGESFRALQWENERLRNLVILLCAALMQKAALDSSSERHAVNTADAELLDRALDSLSRPFPGHELLTSRERVVLAQIVRGASNKEAGRMLGVSSRTIEFHR